MKVKKKNPKQISNALIQIINEGEKKNFCKHIGKVTHLFPTGRSATREQESLLPCPGCIVSAV